MNRKRFVKYLMGKGLPRNKSTLVADYLSKLKIPYRHVEVVRIVRLETGDYHGEVMISGGFGSKLHPKKTVALGEVKPLHEIGLGLQTGNGLESYYGGEPPVDTERIKWGIGEKERQWWQATRPGYNSPVPNPYWLRNGSQETIQRIGAYTPSFGFVLSAPFSS